MSFVGAWCNGSINALGAFSPSSNLGAPTKNSSSRNEVTVVGRSKPTARLASRFEDRSLILSADKIGEGWPATELSDGEVRVVG